MNGAFNNARLNEWLEDVANLANINIRAPIRPHFELRSGVEDESRNETANGLIPCVIGRANGLRSYALPSKGSIRDPWI